MVLSEINIRPVSGHTNLYKVMHDIRRETRQFYHCSRFS